MSSDAKVTHVFNLRALSNLRLMLLARNQPGQHRLSGLRRVATTLQATAATLSAQRVTHQAEPSSTGSTYE